MTWRVNTDSTIVNSLIRLRYFSNRVVRERSPRNFLFLIPYFLFEKFLFLSRCVTRLPQLKPDCPKFQPKKLARLFSIKRERGCNLKFKTGLLARSLGQDLARRSLGHIPGKELAISIDRFFLVPRLSI